MSTPFVGSTRTSPQRRADALMMLITEPGSAGAGALVHLVMGQNVAEHILTTPARTESPRPDPSTESPIDHDDIDGRRELINGVPVHPHWAAAAMTMARFRRLIFSTASEILDHGRTTRLFPAQAKQALLVRARGRCRFPGCDAPITWLEADHLIPWNRDGPTDVANGQVLCSRPNRQKRDTLRPEGEDEDDP
jgi:hypothetical protein